MVNVVPAGTGGNPTSGKKGTAQNPTSNVAPTPSGKQTVPIGVIPGPGQIVQAPINATQKKAIGSLQPGGSHILLMLMIEMLAVGVFTLIAGISNDVGNMVILFMVGLWFIYMITDSKTVSALGNSLSRVATGA